MYRIRFLDLLVLGLCVPFVAVTVPPTLTLSREKIHRARCVSNMKTLWSAFAAFAKEHDDHLPTTGYSGRNMEFDWTWGGNVAPVPQVDPAYCKRIEIEKGSLWTHVTGMKRVGPYGGGVGPKDEWYADPRKNVYLCPTAGPVGKKRGLSYSMNWHLEPGALIGVKLSEVKTPARTVLLVDESEMTLNDGCFIPTGSENDVRNPDTWLKHSGGTNLLFCDGHLDWIQSQQLLQIMDRDDPQWFDPFVEKP